MLPHRVAVTACPTALPRGGAGLPRRETRVAEVFFIGVDVRALLAFPTILLCRHTGSRSPQETPDPWSSIKAAALFIRTTT